VIQKKCPTEGIFLLLNLLGLDRGLATRELEHTVAMTSSSAPKTYCVVTLHPLSARQKDALALSALGRIQVLPLSSVGQLANVGEGVDALLIKEKQLSKALTAWPAAAAPAILVVADEPTGVQILQWMQWGVQDVLSTDECTQIGLGQRMLAAIERHRLSQELRASSVAAYATDLDTGLPHEQQLMEHMSQLMALRERQPSPMALLVFRIEGLATAQARWGTDAAHALRRKVAVRLRAGVRASDVVAFLGEDSFSVLLSTMLAPGDAVQVGAKLMAALHEPFKISGADVAVSAALGIAQYPEDGSHAQALLQRAVGLANSSAAQGRVGFANFSEAGGATAANDD
jgi:diguanylate cyclase (GGDEF)-like protein